MAKLKVRSREYKLMLDPTAFADDAAVAGFWAELRARADAPVRLAGKLDKARARAITFLDTAERALQADGLCLRRRVEEDQVQYTLKCRSEDRYFAQDIDLGARAREASAKLEEDIAAPFTCRFSHSNTIEVRAKKDVVPADLEAAARLFPVLAELRFAGKKMGAASLAPVGPTMAERVLTGGRLVLPEDTAASVALILWTTAAEGPPMLAELSFRIEDNEGAFSRSVSTAARAAFAWLQGLPMVRRDGPTKTAAMYAHRAA